MERKREAHTDRASTAFDTRTTVETDDLAPLSSRRDRLSTIDLIRTYEESNYELQESLAEVLKPSAPTPSILKTARDRSDSPLARGNSTLRTVLARVKSLESENKGLKHTIQSMEDTAKADREVWKRRLLAEIAVSKNRELDLVARFNSIERKVGMEERRMKEAEKVFRNSEAALLVRLEQANADAAAMEARLRKVESDYEDLYLEKSNLEKLCESKDRELDDCRQELSQLAEELKCAYRDLRQAKDESDSLAACELHSRQQLEELAARLADTEAAKTLPTDSAQRTAQPSEPLILQYLREPQEAKRGLRRLKQRRETGDRVESPALCLTPSPRLSAEGK